MRRAFLVLCATIALALAPVVWFVFVLTPAVRGDIVTLLAERFGQAVTIRALHWQFTPSLRLHGEGVTVRREAGDGGAPLMALERFEIAASWRDLLASPRRVRAVEIDGLVVTVPPRTPGEASPAPPAPAPSGASRAPDTVDPDEGGAGSMVVDRVVARRARIELTSSQPDRPPRVFDIPELTLGSLGLLTPTDFEAMVINPTPPGEVKASGRFGPWDRTAPGRTPIAGRYEFTGADLGVFKGVAGTLDSTGTFDGALDDITVTGEARVPDFALSVGRPQSMTTTFTARVSERGGDIDLAPVLSTFASSTLDVAGTIARTPELKGRTIELDVRGRDARIEDLLRLALKAERSPLSGPIELRTRVRIPPGPTPVVSKLELAGEFRMPRATFSNTNVQRTLARISRIGRGETTGADGESVVSDLSGTFTLAGGVLEFSHLRFDVPGFSVRLAGTYALETERLDLAGRVRVARTPSEMAGGRAATLLELADRLLAPESGERGVELPINIRGPRARPSFRVDPAALKRDLGRNLKQNLGDTLRWFLPPPRP